MYVEIPKHGCGFYARFGPDASVTARGGMRLVGPGRSGGAVVWSTSQQSGARSVHPRCMACAWYVHSETQQFLAFGAIWRGGVVKFGSAASGPRHVGPSVSLPTRRPHLAVGWVGAAKPSLNRRAQMLSLFHPGAGELRRADRRKPPCPPPSRRPPSRPRPPRSLTVCWPASCPRLMTTKPRMS